MSQGYFLGMCDSCGMSVYSNDKRGRKLIYEPENWDTYILLHGRCHPIPLGPISQGINRRKRLEQLRA